MKPLTPSERQLLARAVAIAATREYFTPAEVRQLRLLLRRLAR